MPKRIDATSEKRHRTFIREWRKHRGLSQDQLVDRVRERVDTFSKSTLSRLENGKQDYRQPVLEAIAWALNCSEADLLASDPSSPMWSMIEAVSSLPPSERRQIARIIDAFRTAG